MRLGYLKQRGVSGIQPLAAVTWKARDRAQDLVRLS